VFSLQVAEQGDSSDIGGDLGGLLDVLTRSGLIDQAPSWIGTGENKPVGGLNKQQSL
jgi:uncharacterized protein YidB (DUF937 family)